MSTYLYVCQIKGLCPDETEQIQASVTVMPEVEPVTQPADPEPEVIPKVKLESPGSFIVHHGYNHDEFIQDGEFDTYVDLLEAYLEEAPASKIVLVGYADNIASETSNYELGLRRADYTKNYLIAHGISGSLITTTSKGESFPIEKNTTKYGRAKNRRTEIEIN